MKSAIIYVEKMKKGQSRPRKVTSKMKKIVSIAILSILASNLSAGVPMLIKHVSYTNWSTDDPSGHRLPNGERRKIVTYELIADGEVYSNQLNAAKSNKLNKVKSAETPKSIEEKKIELTPKELEDIISNAIEKSQRTQQAQQRNEVNKEKQEREAQRLLEQRNIKQKQLEEQERNKKNKEIKDYELKQIKIKMEGVRKELDDFVENTIVQRNSKIYRDEVERLKNKLDQVNEEYRERNTRD